MTPIMTPNGLPRSYSPAYGNEDQAWRPASARAGWRAFQGECSHLVRPSIGFRDLHATKQHRGVASPEGAERVELFSERTGLYAPHRPTARHGGPSELSCGWRRRPPPLGLDGVTATARQMTAGPLPA